MKDLIQLARPEEGTKNLTCLARLFFGGHLFSWPLVSKAGLVFITVISMIAGAGRFCTLAEEGAKEVAPERVVFTDRVMLLSIGLWVGLFGWVIDGTSS